MLPRKESKLRGRVSAGQRLILVVVVSWTRLRQSSPSFSCSGPVYDPDEHIKSVQEHHHTPLPVPFSFTSPSTADQPSSKYEWPLLQDLLLYPCPSQYLAQNLSYVFLTLCHKFRRRFQAEKIPRLTLISCGFTGTA